jgi:hypothetical protein
VAELEKDGRFLAEREELLEARETDGKRWDGEKVCIHYPK